GGPLMARRRAVDSASKPGVYARRIGSLDAFLIALDERATYDSPNYRWFQARYPRFVYVDRVVVAPHRRGRGLARLLYPDLFDVADRAGYDFVVWEVNISPPNPASDVLHTALGFSEVGQATIHDGSKTVRYLRRAIKQASGSGQTTLTDDPGCPQTNVLSSGHDREIVTRVDTPCARSGIHRRSPRCFPSPTSPPSFS